MGGKEGSSNFKSQKGPDVISPKKLRDNVQSGGCRESVIKRGMKKAPSSWKPLHSIAEKTLKVVFGKFPNRKARDP